jgi:WD40 repeat protein
VAFDATARRLLTSGADSTARIFDVGRSPGRATLPHRNTVVTVDLSLDETMVATTARDGVTRIFDVRAGSVLAEYTPTHGTLVSATFTPANELVVAFQEGTVAFVDPRSGAELRAFESAPIEHSSELRMSLDRRWLAVWQFQKVVRVVSASDGTDAAVDDDERARVVLDLETQMGVVSASGRIVRRDGQSPVIERGGDTIYLRTPRHQVVEAAFAPDGSVVVGAALNLAEVPIFDAASGELVAALRISHPSNAARFSRPGGCIVARWLSAASVVRYPTLAELVELAQAQVYRELTPAERTEFGLPTR